MVAVLLATCAVVAAEAQWRQREHRMRDGLASSIVIGQLPSCLALADRVGDRSRPGDVDADAVASGAKPLSRPGDDGFGGHRAAAWLRGLLNTPPPQV